MIKFIYSNDFEVNFQLGGIKVTSVKLDNFVKLTCEAFSPSSFKQKSLQTGIRGISRLIKCVSYPRK